MVTINYTDEQITQIVQDYLSGVTIDALVEKTGRSKKSLIAKLVKENVYVKDTTVKIKSKTKTEMIEIIHTIIQSIYPVDTTISNLTSLEKCTKGDLIILFEFCEFVDDQYLLDRGSY